MYQWWAISNFGRVIAKVFQAEICHKKGPAVNYNGYDPGLENVGESNVISIHTTNNFAGPTISIYVRYVGIIHLQYDNILKLCILKKSCTIYYC